MLMTCLAQRDYLAVCTVEMPPPGPINVLVPLAFGISIPCPALPGTVVVVSWPMCPVTVPPRLVNNAGGLELGLASAGPGLAEKPVPPTPRANELAGEKLRIIAAAIRVGFMVILQ
jgi:hypothetical protein